MYKKKSFINDKKNSRGASGRTKSRASSTSRPTTKSRCNFCFLVTIRNGAYHVVNGAGDTVHTSHGQLSKDHINLFYSIASTADKKSMNEMNGGDVGAIE